jgi:hypothetical protein
MTRRLAGRSTAPPARSLPSAAIRTPHIDVRMTIACAGSLHGWKVRCSRVNPQARGIHDCGEMLDVRPHRIPLSSRRNSIERPIGFSVLCAPLARARPAYIPACVEMIAVHTKATAGHANAIRAAMVPIRRQMFPICRRFPGRAADRTRVGATASRDGVTDFGSRGR